MSLIVFLVVTAVGLLVTLAYSPTARLGRAIAVAFLAGALVSALLIRPGDTASSGGTELMATAYVRLFLGGLSAAALLLCVLGFIVGWPDRLAPAAMATLLGIAVAISSTDPMLALTAAAAATTPAALIAARMRSTPLGPAVGAAELRTIALVIAGCAMAVLTFAQAGTAANWNNDDYTFQLAIGLLVVGAAVAVRSGAFPFHVPAAMLSRSGEGLGLVVPLVWIPAGLGLVMISWGSSLFDFPGDSLDRAVMLLQAVAVATLVLGALGAMLHDEVEEVAVYSIVADAGFLLLALTARSIDAASPARLWLIVFVLVKSALVAWSSALSSTYRSSSLVDLRGWLRRSPLLGLGLALIVLATIGLPGTPVFEARATLVNLGLPPAFHFVGLAAILLSLAYYLRLVLIGLLTPGEAVAAVRGDRPELSAPEEAEAAPADTAVEAEAGIVSPGPAGADAKPRRRHSLRRRVMPTLRLNRPLEASGLVLLAALLALAVALGTVGSSRAANSGIALDQAIPIAQAGPDGEPLPSPTPEATAEPLSPPLSPPLSGPVSQPVIAPSAATPTVSPGPSGSSSPPGSLAPASPGQ